MMPPFEGSSTNIALAPALPSSQHADLVGHVVGITLESSGTNMSSGGTSIRRSSTYSTTAALDKTRPLKSSLSKKNVGFVGRHSESDEFDYDCESSTSASTVSHSSTSTTASHVRFLDVTDTFESPLPPASQISVEDKARIWWQPEDYKSFDKNIEALVKSMQHRPEVVSGSVLSYGQIIQRVYDACLRAAKDETFEIPKEDQEVLSRWVKHSHNRRGLETFLVHGLGADQSETQQKTLASAQRMYCKSGVSAGTKADAIRRRSEQLSKASRLFARCMALGDAESAKTRTAPRRSCSGRRFGR